MSKPKDEVEKAKKKCWSFLLTTGRIPLGKTCCSLSAMSWILSKSPSRGEDFESRGLLHCVRKGRTGRFHLREGFIPVRAKLFERFCAQFLGPGTRFPSFLSSL